MDTSVLEALISGMFSVISALGVVFLKDYLDTRLYDFLERSDRCLNPEPDLIK